MNSSGVSNTCVGYDASEWIKEVVLPRIARDAENTRYIFPNPLPAFIEFSGARSWYKHLSEATKFYPMLRIGKEQFGIFQTKEKQEENFLDFAFISEDVLFGSDNNGYHVSMQPWSIMQDCGFYLTSAFYNLNLDHIDDQGQEQIFLQAMLKECDKICNRITAILLQIDPNPPSRPFAIRDPAFTTGSETGSQRPTCIYRFDSKKNQWLADSQFYE